MTHLLLSSLMCVSLVALTYAAPRRSMLHRSYAFRLLGLKDTSISSRGTTASKTTARPLPGDTNGGPGTVNGRSFNTGGPPGTANPGGVGITGLNNPGGVGIVGPGGPADIGIRGPTIPADVGMRGSINPADVGMMRSTSPADVGMMRSTSPADVGMMRSTNPADVGMMRSTSPADVGMMRSTNPADVGMMRSTNPTDVGMMTSTNPADVGMTKTGRYAEIPGETYLGKYSDLGAGKGSSSQSHGMEIILPDNYKPGSGGMLTESTSGFISQKGMRTGNKFDPPGSIKTGRYAEIPGETYLGKYSDLGAGKGSSSQSHGMEIIHPDSYQAGSGGMLTESTSGYISQKGMPTGTKVGPLGSTKTGRYAEMQTDNYPGKYSDFGAGKGSSHQSHGMEIILPDNYKPGSGGMLTESTSGFISQKGLPTGNKFDPPGSIKTGRYAEMQTETYPGKYSDFGAGKGSSSQSHGMEIILPDNYKPGSGGMLTESTSGFISQKGMPTGNKFDPPGSTKTGRYAEMQTETYPGKYSDFGAGKGSSSQSHGMEIHLPDNYNAGISHKGGLSDNYNGGISHRGMLTRGTVDLHTSSKAGTYSELKSGTSVSGTGFSIQSQGKERILPDNYHVSSGKMLTEKSLGSKPPRDVTPGAKFGPLGSTKTGKYSDITSGKYSDLGAGKRVNTQSLGPMEIILPDNYQPGSGGMLTESVPGGMSQYIGASVKPGTIGKHRSTKGGKYSEMYPGEGIHIGTDVMSQGEYSGDVSTYSRSGLDKTVYSQAAKPVQLPKAQMKIKTTNDKATRKGKTSKSEYQGYTSKQPKETNGIGKSVNSGGLSQPKQDIYTAKEYANRPTYDQGGITMRDYSPAYTGKEQKPANIYPGKRIIPQVQDYSANGKNMNDPLPKNANTSMLPGTAKMLQALTAKFDKALSKNEGLKGSSSKAKKYHIRDKSAGQDKHYVEIGNRGRNKPEAGNGMIFVEGAMRSQRGGTQYMPQQDAGNGMMFVEGAMRSQRGGTQYMPQQDAGNGMMFVEGAMGSQRGGAPYRSQQEPGNGMMFVEGAMGSQRGGAPYRSQQDAGKGMIFEGAMGSQRNGAPYRSQHDAGKGMIFEGAMGSQRNGAQYMPQQGTGNSMIFAGGPSGSRGHEVQFRPGMVLRPSSVLPQGGVVTLVEGGDVTVTSQGQEQTYEASDLMP